MQKRAVRRDLAVGLGAVVAMTSVAVMLAALRWPDVVETLLLVVTVAAVGWFWGRTVGLMAAMTASTWFAVALTEPAFEASIADKGQVQLTLALIVGSTIAGFAGDLLRTSRFGAGLPEPPTLAPPEDATQRRPGHDATDVPATSPD